MKKKKRSSTPPYFGFPKPIMSKELRLSDEELFSSLNLRGPLAEISKHIDKEDYALAAKSWRAYIALRGGKNLPDAELVATLPDRQLMEEADQIVQHKIVAWGVRRTSFGDKIAFTSFARDHRLEEFHHLVFIEYLAAAYRETKLPKYVIAFEDMLKQWFKQCEKVQPTSMAHPIWNDSGCGIRAIVIIDAYDSMKRARELSPEFHSMVLNILLGSARWLYRTQEKYYPARSGLDACAALVLLGVYFPEFNESSQWFDRGIERIAEKVSEEYSKDGVYVEMSDAYGLKALDRLIYVLGLLRLNGLEKRLPSGYVKKLVSFAEYFAKTCTPFGTTNSFNDSAYVDLVPRLKKWAQLFKHWELLHPVRELLEPVLVKKAKSPSWGPSINMPESGRCVMRGGWEKISPYMAVEYSADDIHSHYETTNLTMFAYGRPMIIDRGRGMTYDDPYHLFLRTSRLHSMVTIGGDNIDLEAKAGEVRTWHSGKMFDCLALAHDGYKKKYNAVVTRTIVFVKPHYWIISDAVLNPKRTVTATSYIHTHPVLVVRDDGNIQCKRPPGFILAQPGNEKCEFLKERAVANMAYLDTQMQWTDWIGFQKRAKAKKGTTFLSVVYPYEREPPEISIIRIDALPLKGSRSVEPTIAEGFEIETPEGTDIFIISRGKTIKRRYGSVTTDAGIGLLRLDSSGKPMGHMLAGATTLEYNKKSLHKTKKHSHFIEKTLSRSRK